MNPDEDPTCEFDHDLDRLLTACDASTPEQPVPFVVDDKFKANWVVRKIVEAREYGQRVKLWAKQEIRRSERDESRLLFLFGRQLELWAAGEIAKLNGRKKRLWLPGGQIGFRRKPMKLVVLDENAVKAWATEHCPKAIKTIEKLLKKPLNEHFMATGEIPDSGVRIEAEQDLFFIK